MISGTTFVFDSIAAGITFGIAISGSSINELSRLVLLYTSARMISLAWYWVLYRNSGKR